MNGEVKPTRQGAQDFATGVMQAAIDYAVAHHNIGLDVIAAQYGVNTSTLSDWMRRAGLGRGGKRGLSK